MMGRGEAQRSAAHGLRFGVVTSLLLALISAASAQPVFPPFSDSFLVNVEANMIERNATLNLRMFYDNDARLARYEIYSASQTTIQFEDWQNQVYYKVTNGTTCVTDTLNSSTSVFPIQFSSANEFFSQGLASTATYAGVRDIRGVPCDTWTAVKVTNRTFTNPRTGITSNYMSNVNYEFSFTIDSWAFRDRFVRAKPLQILMRGQRTNLDTGAVSSFTHHYGFFNYVPYKPEASLFEIPNFCLGIVDRAKNIARNEPVIALATLVAGLFIGLLLMGIVTCIIVHKLKKAQSGQSFTRHQDLEADL